LTILFVFYVVRNAAFRDELQIVTLKSFDFETDVEKSIFNVERYTIYSIEVEYHAIYRISFSLTNLLG
jgi:hypothetical protein